MVLELTGAKARALVAGVMFWAACATPRQAPSADAGTAADGETHRDVSVDAPNPSSDSATQVTPVDQGSPMVDAATGMEVASAGCLASACSGLGSDRCCPAGCGPTTDVDCAGCGNGQIDPGESCEPGTPRGCPTSCPLPGAPSCRRARLVQAGTCQARCESAPDEVECRSGDFCCPPGCSEALDADCVPPNRAFVSSRTYTGDLGGLAGADAKCMDRAREAGLPGTFVAFLSTSTETAVSRVERASGWVRTDGRPFGGTIAELLAPGVLYPLMLDEFGTRVPDDAVAFTGMNYEGKTAVGELCSDWRTPAVGERAMVGSAPSSSGEWFAAHTFDCTSPARLYCFEVSRKALAQPPAIPAQGRLAFVSQAIDPSAGIAGADRACLADAQAAGLKGTFRAALASSAGPAESRLNVAGGPWFRVDRVQIAATARDVGAGRLLAPLSVDAYGGHLAKSVWTGATSFASPASETCSNWSSSDAGLLGRAGKSDRADRSWFNHRTSPCSSVLVGRVYCFQE